MFNYMCMVKETNKEDPCFFNKHWLDLGYVTVKRDFYSGNKV